MKQATARFRRPANGGVRLGRARSAARLLMFVLLLAALVLLTLAVFYYTRNTAQAMEAELCQKMLVSAGQTRNNIDYRFEQVKESASALIGTLYPYLNSDVPFPVSWTVKMKKKQKETQDILSYHSQAAGCSDKARAKASGGRQPIEECGRTGL